MRVLLGPDGDGSTEHLERFYAAPSLPWLRVNMVGTVDGAATGESGKSGSINNRADRQVFDALRFLADAILVGAGTARTEGYRPTDRTTVLVSRRAEVPERLRDGAPGQVLMATTAAAEQLAEARRFLGAAHVLVVGDGEVDLRLLRDELADRGLRQVLSEGGPTLLAALLDQGVVDELDSTVVPRLIAGDHARIVHGPPLDVSLTLLGLLEDHGTLLARWLVER